MIYLTDKQDAHSSRTSRLWSLPLAVSYGHRIHGPVVQVDTFCTHSKSIPGVAEKHGLYIILNNQLEKTLGDLDSVSEKDKNYFCCIYDQVFDEINSLDFFKRYETLPNFIHLMKIKPDNEQMCIKFLNQSEMRLFSNEFKICFVLLHLPNGVRVSHLRMIYQFMSRARVYCYMLWLVDPSLTNTEEDESSLDRKLDPAECIEKSGCSLDKLFDCFDAARITKYGQWIIRTDSVPKNYEVSFEEWWKYLEDLNLEITYDNEPDEKRS